MISIPAGKRPHYVIVGGGIAGCALAYELSKQRQRVTVLEAGSIGQTGASAVPVALLNPNRGRTARASDVDRQGLEAMRALAEELAGLKLLSGMHFPGVLRIATSEKQQKKWLHLPVRQLASQEIPEPYHAPFGGILLEQGGWLYPQTLVLSLKQAAQAQGANFKEQEALKNYAVQKWDIRLETALGTMSADVLILCTGASKNPQFDLPKLEYSAGDVIALATELTLPYPIAGAIYGVKTREHMYIGGNHRAEHECDPKAAENLRKSSSYFIKALADAPISTCWSGLRAKQADNQPLLQELKPKVWFFGALAGRGFLCAYHLAKQLVKSLLAENS